MTDNDTGNREQGCLVCGMAFDTAVAVDDDLTFQADAQICVDSDPNSTWLYFHEYGGGARGGSFDPETQQINRSADSDTDRGGQDV